MKLIYTFQIEIGDIQSLGHAHAEIEHITKMYFKLGDDIQPHIKIEGEYSTSVDISVMPWYEFPHLVESNDAKIHKQLDDMPAEDKALLTKRLREA